MGGPSARRAVDLLKLIRKEGGGDTSPGLRIVEVATTEPHPITFVFEGDNQAVDLDIFEIPVSLYPLRLGDRLFVFPITETADTQRWGALEKLTGGVTMGTMQSANSLKIDGVDKVYGAGELILPLYIVRAIATASDPQGGPSWHLEGDLTPLEAGDRVSLAPTYVGGGIKYVVLNWYGKGG